MATPIKWGNEFLANTITTGKQADPAVIGLANGRYVVTWEDWGSDTLGDSSQGAVHGQVFAADGSKVGSEFLVNFPATMYDQDKPSLTAFPDGKFIAIWNHTFPQNGSYTTSLYGQVFNSDGSRSGDTFEVEAGLTAYSYPSMTPLTNGRFVVAWHNEKTSEITTKIFNANGTPYSIDLVVDAGDVDFPAVTALDNGRFIVVWQNNQDIRGRIYDAGANDLGPEFTINTVTPGYQGQPAVTTLTDGRLVVTWELNWGPSDFDVHGQLLSANGTKIGNEFVVNTDTTGYQGNTKLAALPDGRFVATWSVSSDQIFGQLFNADGTKSGAEFDAGDISYLTIGAMDIATLADGRFVMTGAVADADGLGIGTQVFDPRESGASLNGTALNDDLVGTNFNDIMKGGGGTDHLSGYGGDDLLIGGYGPDTLSGGADSDTASYAGAQFAVTINLATNVNMFGEAQGDILYSIENVIGSDFADTLTGNGLDNILEGGLGADTLIGGGGIDTASYRTSASGVNANLQSGLGFGGDAQGDSLSNTIENLTGSAYADTLTGNGGANILTGIAGNDTLRGAAGNDTLDGGADTDTAVYSGARAQYRVDPLANGDLQVIDLRPGSPDGTDTVRDVENFTFSDGTFAASSVISHAPVIGSSGGGDSAAVSVAENTAAVTTITATDVDAGAPLAYSIVGGADAAKFQINAASGALSFLSAPDFEASADADHNNSYVVQVGASDGGLTDTQTIAVNVVDVAPIISGDGGDNTLFSTSENDTIDGAAGDDTAVFSQSLDKYTLTDFGNNIVVSGPDGTDRLSSIEHLQFADGTINVDDGSALFDTVYYVRHNLDVFHAGVNALDHFNASGWHEGRNPNAFFDTSEYLSVYQDAAASGMNPLDHYHQIGWQLGHDPSVGFDTRLYLVHNPDVAAAGVDPLAHYLQFGMAEGRQVYAAIGDNIVGGFDAKYYLRHNPDVAAAGVDPLAHFNTSGWHEGRNPTAWFDTAGYLAHYSDVAASGANPLEHYELFGWKEGRDPSAHFDTTGYLAANPDVAAAGVNPLDHYLTNGIYEGRMLVNDGLWG